MKHEIVRAEANYTGGNIYIYTGQLADGRFFQTADEWEECVMLLDTDPYEHFDDEDEDNNCTFEAWQKAHTVEVLTDQQALLFWVEMLAIIEKTATYEDWSYSKEYIRNKLIKFDRQFIVNARYDMGDCSVSVMSADEIFSMMDMSDCFDIDIDIYEFGDTFGDPPQHRVFRGCWTYTDDPLRMEITDDDGNVLAVGYGTDH